MVAKEKHQIIALGPRLDHCTKMKTIVYWKGRMRLLGEEEHVKQYVRYPEGKGRPILD